MMGKNILGARVSALPIVMSCYTWRKLKIPERKLRAKKKKSQGWTDKLHNRKKDRLKKGKKEG